MRSRLIAFGLAALTALPFAATSGAHAAGNLAPNPSFEESPTDPVGGATQQPLLPTGWAFEGAAGLFDHSQHVSHTGHRAIAISIPASTTRKITQQGTTVDSPLNVVKDATGTYYSVQPFWRTVKPITVTSGHSYVFSVYTAQDLVTAHVGGAVTKVRWVNANGIPVGETAGASRIAGANPPGTESAWTFISKSVTAPPKAVGAILMLGAADDLFISQIRYDDVYFG